MPKKKKYIALPQVKEFIREQPEPVRDEYLEIVAELELNGRLNMPHGEKLAGEELFAIRVINAGNVRVFYVYGPEPDIFGIYGYVKKTQRIPDAELKKARRIVKLLKQMGRI